MSGQLFFISIFRINSL